MSRNFSVQSALFLVSVAIYITTRLISLTEFPCYFHSDEAIHGVHADWLVHHRLTDEKGNFLPLYFRVAWNLNISTSVYLQAIANFLFGASPETIRGMTGVLSLLVPVSVALIARRIFNAKLAWLAVWYFLSMPLWFLHSRTGFEVGTYVSLFSFSILSYYQYRDKSSIRSGLSAVLCGILAFYSYSAGQVVVSATAAAFWLSDIRFHFRNWRKSLLLATVALILLVPYAHFRHTHPELLTAQLTKTHSYLISDLSPKEKAIQFLNLYIKQLDPRRWFFSRSSSIRHQLGSCGPALTITLPFFIVGVARCLWKLGDWRYRLPLLLYLVAPLPSAISSPSNLRSMTIILPLGLMSILGAELILLLPGMRKIREEFLAFPTFLLVAIPSGQFVADTMRGACTWSKNYTLYGYQWGAPLLFREEIPRFLQSHPGTEVWMSTSWANTPEYFVRFFGAPEGFHTTGMEGFLDGKLASRKNIIFLVTSHDFERLKGSKKFLQLDIIREIPNPSGEIGFLFLKPTYSDDLEKLIEEERQEAIRIRSSAVTINGTPAIVESKVFSPGNTAQAWFDGKNDTLTRGKSAHPFNISVTFENPTIVEKIELVSFHSKLDIKLIAVKTEETGTPSPFFLERQPSKDGLGHFTVGVPRASYKRFEFEIENPEIALSSPASIHVNEIYFLGE